jgi:hypothetical protein
MHRPGIRHPLLSAIAISLVVVACGGTTPSPSPSPSVAPSASPTSSAESPSPSGSADLAAVYAEINGQVQAIRGLDEKKPIEPNVVSQEELTEVIRTSFDKDYPPEEVAADEALYHALGLLPKDQKLADVYVELLESQVAGLYDPISEEMYVLSKQGGVGPVEEVFYSHEYDHALQDQHFDLEAIQEGLDGKSDTSLARQSLVEGDAYLTMQYWLQQNLSAEDLGEIIAASADPEALAVLQRTPPIVQAQILFSATEGTEFVRAIQAADGWPAVDAAFGNLPQSTEQILHPDIYVRGEDPVAVDLPDDIAAGLGEGWSLVKEDTLGEYQTSIWLGAPSVAAAVDGAAGWGGDRVALASGPDGAWALAWQTIWDSPDDAAEFETVAETAVTKAGGPGAVLPGIGGTTRWVVLASDDPTLSKLTNVLGLAG